MPPKSKPLELDGRSGEGGGQLVRICVALAAVTGTPIRIVNVRGNRSGGRGGGLKAQHVSGISFLSTATSAIVSGLEVGSRSLTFCPSLPPSSFATRNISISASTPAASALLILQAILPFLLFASSPTGNDPISLSIHGGTNVSWSPSFEYLDQVLLPTLQDWFGIRIARELRERGWSTGPGSSASNRGHIHLQIHPLPLGSALEPQPLLQDKPLGEDDFHVGEIDISIITPTHLHGLLQTSLSSPLSALFPDSKINFLITEESGHPSRVYVLLVAKSASGRLRWGRDVLFSEPRQKKSSPENIASLISARVCEALHKEVLRGGVVDEFLQDQLVVFQALADGRTGFPRPNGDVGDGTGFSSPDLEEDRARDGAYSYLEDGLREDGDDESKNSTEQENWGKERKPFPSLTNLSPIISRIESQLGGNGHQQPKKMSTKKTSQPFGQGSMHAKTARWVASVVLPGLQWYNDGVLCEGAGVKFGEREGGIGERE